MRKIQFTRGSLYRLLALIAIIAAIVWLPHFFKGVPPVSETPVVSLAEKPAPVPLKTVLQAEQTFVCERGRCAEQPAREEGSVTDGEWWYYYDEELGIKNQELGTDDTTPGKVYLRRRNSAGATETIMESTPLTRPRDLFLSPNGKHVAFWLDNTAEPEAELTELWVYDAEDKGVRLLAEKIYRPDVRSDVFWNANATHLWFIADTGAQTLLRDQLELVLVNAASPGISAAFATAPWGELAPNIEEAHVDLSQRADHLAYVTRSLLGKPVLAVHTLRETQRTSVRGAVKYTQWLEDDSLLYALQDKDGFTFWQVRDGLHRFIARRPGELAAARSDSAGKHIVFATTGEQAQELFSLYIQSGTVTAEGSVPNSETKVAILWVEPLPAESPTPRKADAASLDDAELAAFINKNFAGITGEGAATPLRLIVTEQPNVVFLDYRDPVRTERRVQVKIYEAVNADWSIIARYEPVNREWRKVQGAGVADPKPLRLYEWEESLKQWVLKKSLE